MWPFCKWFNRRDCASISDAGLVRTDNQDAFFVDGRRLIFCVADGMGGGAAGATASRILCEEVGCCATERLSLAEAAGVIDAAVRRANGRIRRIISAKGYESMCTTMAILVFCPAEPGLVAIGHVGDSRVYRKRGAVLKPMTRDHRKSAFSHLLTRAVGGADALEVEWIQASSWNGDVWLVCTDGVHDMLPDSTIGGILAHGGRISGLAESLADAVRRAGARDNFTFCLVR